CVILYRDVKERGARRAGCAGRNPRTRFRFVLATCREPRRSQPTRVLAGAAALRVVRVRSVRSGYESNWSRLQPHAARIADSSAALIAFLYRAPETPFTRRSHSAQVA